MSKKIISLIGLPFVFLTGVSQTVISEGVIRYKETRLTVTNSGKERKTVAFHSLYFSDRLLKQATRLSQNVFFTSVINPETKQMRSYATNGNKYYMMDETYDPTFSVLGLYGIQEPAITFSEDTLTVKNYKCKKAVLNYLINGNDEKMEVWYSPDIKLSAKPLDNFFKVLSGIPVKFNFTNRPRMSIGNGIYETYCEFIIDTLYQTENAEIGNIKNIEKYENISGDDKLNKIANMLLGGSTKGNQKGEAITQQRKNADGSVLTLTKYNPFKEGEKIQNFNALNYEGAARSLESYKGNIIVLNFWFTKCVPCVKEMPLLNKVAATFIGKKVSFLSMTYNSKEEIDSFLKTNTFNFEKIIEAGSLIEMYGVSAYPSTIIIDAAGIIRFVKTDAFEDENELQKEIDAVLK